MPAFQFKLRVFVVIEFYLCPAIFHMAIFTLFAVGAFVLIIITMTFGALLGDVFVAFVDMAQGTVDANMLALQREVSPCVVKKEIFPARLFMANFAFLTELAVMRLIFFVAIDAFPRRFAEFLLRIVATRATHFFVTIAQRKIGLIVVECSLIQ